MRNGMPDATSAAGEVAPMRRGALSGIACVAQLTLA